jgi:MurNAc alpha-1-phosphate uridylyltransferase
VSQALPPICILAGGLATRLGQVATNRPKALVEVAGEPFIFHQLRLLRAHGAQRVVICVGHLGSQIIDRVGSKRCGLDILYSDEGPRPRGTLHAICKASALLGERFLVLYGDTYLRIDYLAAVRAWARSGLPAMMTVLRNRGLWGISNASFDGHFVTAYNKNAPSPGMQWIDYGLGGLTAPILATDGVKGTDLADLYGVLAERKGLFGFEATARFYEIGTPSALAETSAFLSSEVMPRTAGSNRQDRAD